MYVSFKKCPKCQTIPWKPIFWSFDLPIFILQWRGCNRINLIMEFQFVLADRSIVQVRRNTLHQVFLEGGGRFGGTRGGRYLPRKCSCATCPGPEGLGGQRSPNPETRESHPLQAGGQRTGWWHMTPHKTPQPIRNQHGCEDKKTWKQTNQNK